MEKEILTPQQIVSKIRSRLDVLQYLPQTADTLSRIGFLNTKITYLKNKYPEVV